MIEPISVSWGRRARASVMRCARSSSGAVGGDCRMLGTRVWTASMISTARPTAGRLAAIPSTLLDRQVDKCCRQRAVRTACRR